MIVRQTLGRELDTYSSPSPTAVVARQLAEHDKNLHPGQVVRFVYTLGKPGVRAWDISEELDGRTINVAHYSTLKDAPPKTIFQPFLSDGIETGSPLLLGLFSPNKATVFHRIDD